MPDTKPKAVAKDERLSSDVAYATYKENKDTGDSVPAPGPQVVQEPGVASE